MLVRQLFRVTQVLTMCKFAIKFARNVEETVSLLISAGADIMQEDRTQT